MRTAIGKGFYLEMRNSEKKVSEATITWMKKLIESEIGDLIIELTVLATKDWAIYGYAPWDYAQELGLNLKKQGYSK